MFLYKSSLIINEDVEVKKKKERERERLSHVSVLWRLQNNITLPKY